MENRALRMQFESNKDIAKLMRKADEFHRAMNLVGEMAIRKQISNMWDEVLKGQEIRKVSIVEMIEKEENMDKKADIISHLYAMSYMADVFEGILWEFKDYINKVDEGSEFVRYDPMALLMKEVKTQVMDITSGCSEDFCVRFADNTEEMKDLILGFVNDKVKENR